MRQWAGRAEGASAFRTEGARVRVRQVVPSPPARASSQNVRRALPPAPHPRASWTHDNARMAP